MNKNTLFVWFIMSFVLFISVMVHLTGWGCGRNMINFWSFIGFIFWIGSVIYTLISE